MSIEDFDLTAGLVFCALTVTLRKKSTTRYVGLASVVNGEIPTKQQQQQREREKTIDFKC